VNLQVFLNTNVTSRRLENDETEALLIVDEAATPAIYRGRTVLNAENAIVWPGVLVNQPGQGVRTFRITDLRANAAGLGTTATLIPTQVVAYISASPAQSLPVDNPQQSVGYVQTGLLFNVRACTGDSPGTEANFLRCIGQNNPDTGDLIGGTSGNMQFALRFQEGFQSAFKPQFGNDEPGANSGTRLQARFNNVPAGVRIFVTSSPSFGSSPGLQAALVNSSGAATPPASSDRTLFCAAAGAAGFPGIEIPVVNGTATAVWEITGSNPSVTENAVFGVAIAYAPDLIRNLPGTGIGSVTGSFAPAYIEGSGAGRGSAVLPIPRFAKNVNSEAAFRINACTTALLFPFLTSTAGFDTGIAISNASRDPFPDAAGRPQSGACTFHFYGAVPSRQTTNRMIAPGETITAVLSSGGDAGLLPVPGFTGYAIAECEFLHAHGFAFITDGPVGAARVAEGYLALVLGGGLRGSSIAEARGH
jgi:hypothetical protein